MILVTGGAGFIGANFVLDWLAQSDEGIVNVDKLGYAANRQSLAALDGDSRHVFVHGDIADRALVTALLHEHRPRAMIHFAAESHVDRSIHDPSPFMESNIAGTFALLESVRDYWQNLSVEQQAAFRWMQVSTDEVYGALEPDAAAFTEMHPCLPNSPYAASKAAADHLVRAWHHTYGLPVLTTRCSNNFGPRQFPEKFIPLLILNALSGRSLPVYGDGLQVRDWLYVGDHCGAIRAVLASGEVGATYNIGAGQEKTNLEVVDTVCSLLDELQPRADGRSYRAQIEHVADRPGHDRRYAIDATLLRTELGWAPAVPFEGGLRNTVSWYLTNATWLQSATRDGYAAWMAQQYAGVR
ncbi:dTDP-glucose 4,6-dehydratase [Jeongeupia naejangsanensis]|uniref:dTDP-glucose 4,6-dehydratase n=1 Tax=Jeongeupia naejangsanensis TaxID=613195 RepID=A0ABS2BPQ5_9NEIS|nr:dTDP-glucose 4,6-dehydratase [Jeongeupia naejangsanensis]MBM3117410.1 dTDP-glucose 4,6-dehydratase [Jeongeupia naejangsanensis]